jgi:hypothetical protein
MGVFRIQGPLPRAVSIEAAQSNHQQRTRPVVSGVTAALQNQAEKNRPRM